MIVLVSKKPHLHIYVYVYAIIRNEWYFERAQLYEDMALNVFRVNRPLECIKGKIFTAERYGRWTAVTSS